MKTILVVDDEELVLNAVSDILKENGYDVVTAVDGKDGLEKHKQYGPDIVITDIVMPDMEGIELLKSLHRTNEKTPIIVMSGHAVGSKFLHVAKLMGARESLLKPFSKTELLTAVERALG